MWNITDAGEFLTPHLGLLSYSLFCLASGVFSVLVLHLDKALVDSGRASILRVTYDKSIPRKSWHWFRGASIAALIGGALQIWKPSLYAAAVVGLSWQVLLTQFLDTIKRREEPVQPASPDAEDIGEPRP
jgi:hypothetical protein